MQYNIANSTNNSNYTTIYIVLIIIVVLVLLCIFSTFFNGSNKNENMSNINTKFIIKFRTNWGQPSTENVINYPKPPQEEAPHTGNMFLAIHNSNYNAFKLN